ncbi:hypothetical protein H5410_001797 [Solanum commersonii]|uniref:Uncharacterized protein n=1 Tax=Solanum commersonii TaxID=4109 RepID=A0A9J6B023_SOLCO|nr:hypothetical protein H5410_001797 [Solanum commersonii]
MFITDFENAWIYPVTTVDRVSVAISILPKEKEKVDVMIINVPSPDSLCFKLFKQVDALDIKLYNPYHTFLFSDRKYNSIVKILLLQYIKFAQNELYVMNTMNSLQRRLLTMEHTYIWKSHLMKNFEILVAICIKEENTKRKSERRTRSKSRSREIC